MSTRSILKTPFNPSQKESGISTQEPSNPPFAFVSTAASEFQPELSTTYDQNLETNMSSPHPPELYFPDELPPPTGIPIRAPAQDPKFAELDEAFSAAPHPSLSSQGKACGGYDETQDESRSKEALQALEAHIKARAPYIALASSRLQAACGLRNDSIFDLPKPTKCHWSPSMQPQFSVPKEGFLGSMTDIGGVRANSFARAPQNETGLGFVPKSPIGFQAVDPKTGKGLREFLLQKGKEGGMRKQECGTITFYDFTPDMRSGNYQNVLLGHYAAEKGERIDVYEVDLPATGRNERGDEVPTIESWLWILIARPLVSYDPKDSSTFVAPKGSGLTSPASATLHNPFSHLASHEPEPFHAAPPNFPHPMPLSWLVFAAPKAHVSTYPIRLENPDGTIATQEFRDPKPSSRTHYRIDYDFSFSGIPLFEFSCADLFTGTSAPTEFLSIEQMGAWSKNDAYVPYSEDEYRRMYSLWEDGEWASNASKAQPQRFDQDGQPTAPMPPPNRGVWWKVFYERMAKDVERWKKIKTAMGRGKCRVVVRWTVGNGDEGVKNSNAMGAKYLGAPKGLGKRLTRSETRRRSGLSEETPMGLEIGGVVGLGALGESSSPRAGGNIARAGVIGAEREKAKVRKR